MNRRWFVTPMGALSPQTQSLGVLVLLAASCAALLAAPLLMPPGYSWLHHTTSESAAQGVQGAWLARLGFLLFGLAVVLLTAASRRSWARGAVLFHAAFGVCMVAAAAVSHRSWLPDAGFDAVEDALHSLMATTMGFAFALGVLARFILRRPAHSGMRVFDVVALVTSVVVPLLMAWGGVPTGLVQRLMFLVAYLWYALEALVLRASAGRLASHHP